MTIIETKRSNEMIKSIIDKTKNHGWLPAQHFNNLFRPSMVGDHLVPIVVDAYIKGIGDYDINYIYEMMKRKAIENAPAGFDPANNRPGLDFLEKHGYIPVDEEDESVAATLEFAYDDWCVAQLAKKLGKEDDYRYFSKRALNYKNVYDQETGFMRPRMSDGSWLRLCKKGELPKPAFKGDHSYYGCFDPLFIGTRPNRHYAESNAWHYLWSVQHDVPGLINLMGGKDAFTKKLDEFFTMSPEITGPNYVGVVGTIGQYVHGNQPSQHEAYLYDYAGQPWKHRCESIR
jgi:predicted alpha-1,2-mannosidase